MKRLENESSKDYKKRRKIFDAELHTLKMGKLIWNSDKQGQKIGSFKKEKPEIDQ